MRPRSHTAPRRAYPPRARSSASSPGSSRPAAIDVRPSRRSRWTGRARSSASAAYARLSSRKAGTSLQRPERVSSAERRPQGSGRVVLVRRRHTERRHHGVADELFDRPALRLELLAHRPEVRREHLLEPLGVQALAEARRAGHVREQDRHQTPLLTRGTGSSGSSAEPHAGQKRASTGTSAPQVGHDGTSDDPHDEQKRALSGFSTPHAAQVFTGASVRPGTDAERVGARPAERPEAMRASLRLRP